MEEQQAIVAAKDGDVATLERLLEAGVLGPGITDSLGAGLVHHATRTGHLDCVKFLVQRAGLPSNQRAHNGATPVHDAAAAGSLAELCWLVRDGGCRLQVSRRGSAWQPVSIRLARVGQERPEVDRSPLAWAVILSQWHLPAPRPSPAAGSPRSQGHLLRCASSEKPPGLSFPHLEH